MTDQHTPDPTDRHTRRDDGPCPGCYSADGCHRTSDAIERRRADVYMSDGGEI